MTMPTYRPFITYDSFQKIIALLLSFLFNIQRRQLKYYDIVECERCIVCETGFDGPGMRCCCSLDCEVAHYDYYTDDPTEDVRTLFLQIKF